VASNAWRLECLANRPAAVLQGGELVAGLLDLLLLGLQLSLLVQDEGSDGSWSLLPARF
jgi:hypothetical protein